MVPTDPIFQARSTLFKNAFMEYGVPKSILKLKQGF
jgi:Rad3-related DNA helicase